jgi:hypothetical protein
MSDMHELPPTKAMIGRWEVDRYVSLLRRWSLLAALVAAALTLLAQPRALVIGWEIVVATAIGWLIARRNGGKIESLAGGAFIGISLGIVVPLCRFVLSPTLANGVLILIEGALTTIIAALVVTASAMITTLIHQQKN